MLSDTANCGAKKEVRMNYSKGFKQNMVRRLAGPGRISAAALSRAEGVSQTTLSKWLREAGTLTGMKNKNNNNSHKRRPQDWPLEDKLRAIIEIDQLPADQVGAYLRKNGLYEAQIKQWLQAVSEALDAGALRKERSKKDGEKKTIKRLEKELRRKEKALAEAAALLMLKKKAAAIWGDEDDDTTSRKDK